MESKVAGALMTGLDVLEALSVTARPVGVSELARLVDADKGNIHRLLAALERRGYVARNEETKAYQLAPAVILLAGTMLRNMDLVSQARPLMRTLVNITGESVHLAQRTSAGGVYLARERLARRVTVETEIGAPVIVHATSTGKALFCRSDEAVVLSVLDPTMEAYTDRTIVDQHAFLRELAKVSDQGFALDLEELSFGVRCVAAPVVDIGGSIVATVGMSGPANRLDDERLGECAKMVCTTARELSATLGGDWDFPDSPI